MIDQCQAHGLLAVVYTVTAIIFTVEQAFAHAICAAVAALIYVFMSSHPSDRRPHDSSDTPGL